MANAANNCHICSERFPKCQNRWGMCAEDLCGINYLHASQIFGDIGALLRFEEALNT